MGLFKTLAESSRQRKGMMKERKIIRTRVQEQVRKESGMIFERETLKREREKERLRARQELSRPSASRKISNFVNQRVAPRRKRVITTAKRKKAPRPRGGFF